jgi:hypothetical protein
MVVTPTHAYKAVSYMYSEYTCVRLKKLHGLRLNYTDQATAACRRS